MPDIDSVHIRKGGIEVVDVLAELYLGLHDHHRTIEPELAGAPARSGIDAWGRRRARYASWLESEGSVVLLAQLASELVGYAILSVSDGYDGWQTGEQIGEVRDLAVQAQARGQGVGAHLLDNAERHFASLGLSEYRLNVLAANHAAQRLYARRGMHTATLTMVGRVAGPSAEGRSGTPR